MRRTISPPWRLPADSCCWSARRRAQRARRSACAGRRATGAWRWPLPAQAASRTSCPPPWWRWRRTAPASTWWRSMSAPHACWRGSRSARPRRWRWRRASPCLPRSKALPSSTGPGIDPGHGTSHHAPTALVLGGYGNFGASICRALAGHPRIGHPRMAWLVAGRNGASAQALAATPGHGAQGLARVSRHGSDVVGCAHPTERSARRIAQPMPRVLASDATPLCAPMASADRQMIGDATLARAGPVSRGAAQHHAGPGHARSIVFLFLALRQRFAAQHRMALELIERLLQLEVLVGAKLRRPAVGDGLFGLVLQAQAGFFAGFFTGLVLLFFALAAAQMLV